MKHPTQYRKIPRGAYIVFTQKNDSKFSAENLTAVKQKEHKRRTFIEARKERGGWKVQPLTV